MRISDWSSDVCSSDLVTAMLEVFDGMMISGSADARTMAYGVSHAMIATLSGLVVSVSGMFFLNRFQMRVERETESFGRSEERRVGKECVSTCRSRWSPDHYKKTKTTHKDIETQLLNP